MIACYIVCIHTKFGRDVWRNTKVMGHWVRLPFFLNGVYHVAGVVQQCTEVWAGMVQDGLKCSQNNSTSHFRELQILQYGTYPVHMRSVWVKRHHAVGMQSEEHHSSLRENANITTWQFVRYGTLHIYELSAEQGGRVLAIFSAQLQLGSGSFATLNGPKMSVLALWVVETDTKCNQRVVIWHKFQDCT